MLLEFSLAVFSCLNETQSAVNVNNISSTHVAESYFLMENLNSGC